MDTAPNELDLMTSGTTGDRRQREIYWETLKRTIPSPWVSNHWNESQAYVGVVFPIVNAICRSMSAATVQIMRRKRIKSDGSIRKAMSVAGAQESDEDWEPIDESDEIFHQCKVFERPNPRQSIGNILYECTLQECLTGTDMTWKVPNGYGEPCELYVIPTALTNPYPLSHGYPNGAYRITTPAVFGPYAVLPTNSSAVGAVIPAEQMAVNRTAHPLAQWDGYSPLLATNIQRDVLEAIDIMRWAAAEQGVEPSMILETPLGTTQAQIDQINLKIEQKFSGAKNRGKVMALLGGMKGIPWGKSLADLGGMEIWEQLTTFMCSVYNIPKEVVGLISASTYATYFAALKQFYTNTLIPLCNMRGQFWTREIIQPVWGDEYRVQINPPAIDDKEEQRERLRLAKELGILRKGTAANMLGLPTFGDERDDEICGEPSREERDFQREQMQFQMDFDAKKKAADAERAAQQKGNPLQGDLHDDLEKRPINLNGRGSLNGKH